MGVSRMVLLEALGPRGVSLDLRDFLMGTLVVGVRAFSCNVVDSSWEKLQFIFHPGPSFFWIFSCTICVGL